MSDDAGAGQSEHNNRAAGGSGGGGEPHNTNSNNYRSEPDNAANRLLEHFKQNKIDSVLLGTRLAAILFTILYVIPIVGNPQSSFHKVLLANAAISALRLHQRLPAFTFSREFLAHLFSEDSCHYLMYSIIFFNVSPTLLILVPITLFAILHTSSYSLRILDVIGQNSFAIVRFAISIVELQAYNILKAAAFAEIFIMPNAILYTFLGSASLMTPIIYYHFLIMRYSSHRNPYTRNAFAELRAMCEALASRSPQFVAVILRSGIYFVNRLAPVPQQVQPTTAQ